MRRSLAVLGAALGALGAFGAFGAWSRGGEPAARPEAPVAAPSSSRASPVASTPSGPLGVLQAAPRGERVRLREPIEIELVGEPDRAALEKALVIRPATSGTVTWPEPHRMLFTPARWRPGRVHDVRLEAPGDAGPPLVSYRFRTRVPRPRHVVPGEGAPIVLSFDDGPVRFADLGRLLDLLRGRGAHVLFFPAGRWLGLEAGRRFVERAEAEGHRVCNHTRDHANLTLPQMTDAKIKEQIENGAGRGRCDLFRPPEMAWDTRVERIAKELGYRLYFWDIDTRDWEGTPARDLVNLVLGRARPGAVVLFHLHAEHVLDALPELLDRLGAAGYRVDWQSALDGGLPEAPDAAPGEHERRWDAGAPE